MKYHFVLSIGETIFLLLEDISWILHFYWRW